MNHLESYFPKATIMKNKYWLFFTVLVSFHFNCLAQSEAIMGDTFNINIWRSLVKKDIQCHNKKALSYRQILALDKITPPWDTSDILIMKSLVGKIDNSTLCLISLENQGELYQSYVGVFWLKNNICKGIRWDNGQPIVINQSGKNYYKLKKMNKKHNNGLVNFGSKMIFTEISNNIMLVKVIIEPTIEQENKFHTFLRND